MVTSETPVLDPKLIPPQILAKVLIELEQNRDLDMGGYSVPCNAAFDLFSPQVGHQN